MKICIENEIEVEFYDDSCKELLKKLSIYFSEKDDIITILDQKVNLTEDDMEDFLDILSFSNYIISLERYSKGRYTLKVD